MIQPRSAGFTLMEVMVSIFVLGVATVAVTGLAVTGVRTSFESERQTIALSLVNGEAESVKAMSYFEIGYADATGTEPDGTLHRQETVTRNGLSYTLTRTIELVDDSANGTLPAGSLTEASADYKRVNIKAAWLTAGGSPRDVSVVVTVTPQLNCAVGNAGSGGGQACTAGAALACPNPNLLQTNTADNSCVTGGGPYVAAGDANGGTPGTCIYNSVTCPASGRCPAPSAAPTCPPGAAFCSQCVSNIDCGAGYVCSSGQCYAQTGACTRNSDCSSGQVCNPGTGACSPNCTSGTCSCGTGYACDVTTGLCATPTPSPTPTPTPTPTQPPPTPCVDDTQCPVVILV